MDGIDDLTQREPGFPLIVGVPTSLCTGCSNSVLLSLGIENYVFHGLPR